MKNGIYWAFWAPNKEEKPEQVCLYLRSIDEFYVLNEN